MMNRWTVILFEAGCDGGSFTLKVADILSVSRRNTGRMPAVGPPRGFSRVVRLIKLKSSIYQGKFNNELVIS